jgi:glycerol-3-phosphate dehydrogenase (NAD(P)+)
MSSNQQDQKHITILGAGAWGTALALSLAPRHRVTLWTHRASAAEALQQAQENRRYLPGFPFPESLIVTADDTQAIASAEILVVAVPSEFLRPTIDRILPHIHLPGRGTPSDTRPRPSPILVSATKGLSYNEATGTYLRISEVIQQAFLQQFGIEGDYIPVGALSGPSFAQELAANQPTAVTIAFHPAHSIAAGIVQQAFSSPALRLYTNTDLIGVELGGALKNVIAIAAGILTGLGLGLNSAAGLITRGIAEITRLAVAAGAQRETLGGLSGLGDLVLTCTGPLSRNRTVGIELGRGRKLPEILAALDGKVAEGLRTTRAALGLAQQLNVEMPITEQIGLILDQGKSPQEAIKDLMQRPTREES